MVSPSWTSLWRKLLLLRYRYLGCRMYICRAVLTRAPLPRLATICVSSHWNHIISITTGKTDLEQLSYIFNVMGTPTEDSWPNASALPGYVQFESREPVDFSSANRTPFQTTLRNYPAEFTLLLKMLVLNPRKRISSAQVSMTSGCIHFNNYLQFLFI